MRSHRRSLPTWEAAAFARSVSERRVSDPFAQFEQLLKAVDEQGSSRSGKRTELFLHHFSPGPNNSCRRCTKRVSRTRIATSVLFIRAAISFVANPST
jgi:hypothetical protein